jgi:hypothetical protein
MTGYLAVVRTVGRQTGRVRYAAVMYAIDGGDVFCMAGWGPGTHWYRNALQRPHVTVLIPGRSVQGIADDLQGSEERARALRLILTNSGVTAFTEGVNPWRDTDETILARSEHKPVVRIRPLRGPIESGPFDPGGKGWLLVPAWLAGLVGLMFVRRRLIAHKLAGVRQTGGTRRPGD